MYLGATAKEVKMIVDCGPLGYQNIAAHGHADALSFYLSVEGKEFFIDPGTYAYNTSTKWRNYFRGTSAHNTIRIDNKNQSVIGGNFMWLEKAESKLIKFDSENIDNQIFIGEHFGYHRLEDPVTHRRSITYNNSKRTFIINDQIFCASEHLV